MQDGAMQARPQAAGERFVGRTVTCAEGSVVGRVRSVRRSADETISYAVVSLGSFPRMGDDLRAVPLGLLRDAGEGCGLLCPAELLRSAPIVTGPSRCGDPQFCRRVAEHFQRLA
jgi:hypothetical protein